MRLLVDTNILLRLQIVADPRHAEVDSAVRALQAAGHDLVITAQGASEFWNTCTRPVAARGGYGLSVADADRHLRDLESTFGLEYDSDRSYAIWRHLVVAHGVRGVQVHDARIAALTLANGFTHILTYNGKDFTRFPGITALSPVDFVAGTVPPP
jgi:predicted nucleic acid-binding protein